MNKPINRETIRKGIALLSIFVLSILIALTSLLLVVNVSLFTEYGFNRAIKKSDYVNASYGSLNETVAIELKQYGIKPSVLEGLFNPEMFENDLRDQFGSVFNQEELSIDYSSITNELDTRLKAFILAQDLTLTVEIETGLKEIEVIVLEAYRANTAFPFRNTYTSLTKTFQGVYVPLVAIGVALIGLLIVFLRKLLSAKDFRNNMTIVLASSGWMLVLAPAYFYFEGFYKRINLNPQHLNDLIASLIGNLFLNLILIGCMVLVGSLALSLIKKKD